MGAKRDNRKLVQRIFQITMLIVAAGVFAGLAWAQMTASVGGSVRDTSGAVVPGATVTVKHLESGLVRTAESDANGSYNMPSVPVGEYEIAVEKTGFQTQIRKGITLVVGQQAQVNLTLSVGAIEQQVTVTGEAPLVDVTPSSTAGLVGEKEVKDLPLNGRSFDQLVTLNVGVTNYTANTSHNAFSVGGRRPEENRFVINGVEYVGSDSSGQLVTPTGISGNLLGVDAVREFNVVQGTYGAEYGKRAGGQVNIVSSSGTNQLHGDGFEFLRNSDLDASNYFSNLGNQPNPPFKRNQFGGSLGGPIKRDKLFIFGTYEGLRQRLGQSVADGVPDQFAVQGMLPCGIAGVPCGNNPTGTETLVPNLQLRMLPYLKAYWPAPNGPELGGGLANYYASPVQAIRDDFGMIRQDYTISSKDSLSGSYLMDDGLSSTPGSNPIYITNSKLRSQVISVQETRVFSPTLLNVATIGFARGLASSGSSYIGTIALPAGFVTGPSGIGQIVLGSQGTTSVIPSGGGPNTGLIPTYTARNVFTYSDDVHYMRGIHAFSIGGWLQRGQENISGPVAFLGGQISYPSLLAVLQDTPTTFFAVPAESPMGFRQWEAAWYVQDEMKLRSNLTLRIGLRDEMTNGWNEVAGRATNYFYTNGVINTNSTVGSSALSENKSKALFEPRVGLAWDPSGTGKWSVRAGGGVYRTLQDNLAHRLVVNPPFNSQIEIDNTPLFSIVPVAGGTQPPPQCQTPAQLPTVPKGCTQFQPGGIEPGFQTPTAISWSINIDRQITRNTMVSIGYAGSESYHGLVSVDMNTAPPQICNNAAGCLAGGTGAVPVNQGGTLAAGRTPVTSVVPQGTLYEPPGPRLNPVLGTQFAWFFEGNSSYHSLRASFQQRLSHGLQFKADYSFSKALDINSAITASGGANEPQTVLNPYNLAMNHGLAAFNLRHQFNFNFSYELPFGSGKALVSGASGVLEKLIGGWQWNGIVQAQSGFPFTPTANQNISGTGDTRNPDVPSMNPNFTGPVILGTQARWYNPQAFILPQPGTFGNAGRERYTGPGLTNVDTSLFKSFKVTERWNLQFRAEAFNVLNHTNLGQPNAAVFQGANYNSTAGRITKTSTASRQLQFALKLIF